MTQVVGRRRILRRLSFWIARDRAEGFESRSSFTVCLRSLLDGESNVATANTETRTFHEARCREDSTHRDQTPPTAQVIRMWPFDPGK